MIIKMFNGWYFFWIFLAAAGIVGLYFLLRNRSVRVQKIVLFSLLLLSLIFHFLKFFIGPYSVDNDRWLRDSWFVTICEANVFVFTIFFFSKNKYIKDFMFYIGILSGVVAYFYPAQPLDSLNQMAEQLDTIRYYYYHFTIIAVPLLMVLFKHHTLSYKRVWVAPTGFMLLLLFIMLNQIFQSELGFVPLRDGNLYPNYKNASYIWGPFERDGVTLDPVGKIFTIFTPEVFKTMPIAWSGSNFEVGTVKYWPWFWLLFPAYILITPLSFLMALIFDFKNFKQDMVVCGHWVKKTSKKIRNKFNKNNERSSQPIVDSQESVSNNQQTNNAEDMQDKD